MLTQLRLLILEDADDEMIKRHLPDDEVQSLAKWYGSDDKALAAFMWCVNKGMPSYGTAEQHEAFSVQASVLGIEEERLLSLFCTHTELYYKGSHAVKSKSKPGRGRFIVFEGLDGTGKTTHIRRLCKSLRADGRQVYETAEPTEYATGGLIRDALGGLQKRTSAELAAMFLADRISHNTNAKDGIAMMLDRGADVVCSRYYYSSLAYQGVDSDIEWVAGMNLGCPQILKPDVCIFLDLSAELCAGRIANGRLKSEIFETYETIKDVKHRFAHAFRMINADENIYIINTNREPDAVAAEIYETVKGIL